MHQLFREKHPNETISYETYRKVFNNEYNISFGYPRSDTCSKCDTLRSQILQVSVQIDNSPDDRSLHQRRLRLETEKEVHQRKAETFYTRKRYAKTKAKTTDEVMAIAFDFQREMPCPNKATNDVYYRRQLSLHSFNIHALATDSVHIYAYDETVAKKGADEVTSMLLHYFQHYVPREVRTLLLFCDSCCGQNKNYTMIRFLYYVVHSKGLFDCIKLTFPERGHSYMECDRDMGLINRKSDVELPGDWMNVFKSARKHPSAYEVVQVTQNDILAMTAFLRPHFKGTCPFPTRPVKELVIQKGKPLIAEYRDNWNGPLESMVLANRKKGNTAVPDSIQGQPAQLYTSVIPVSDAKYKDLQVLKRFCLRAESQEYYTNLRRCSKEEPFHDQTSESEDEP